MLFVFYLLSRSLFEHDDINQFTTYETISEHSLVVNGILEDYVAKWVKGTTFPIPIRKKGKALGKTHKTFFDAAGIPSEQAVCNLVHTLVEQMADTCYYSDYVEAYANVAALLMKGFSQGLKADTNILKCKENLDGEIETFNQLYGKYLSKRVKQIVK